MRWFSAFSVEVVGGWCVCVGVCVGGCMCVCVGWGFVCNRLNVGLSTLFLPEALQVCVCVCVCVCVYVRTCMCFERKFMMPRKVHLNR